MSDEPRPIVAHGQDRQRPQDILKARARALAQPLPQRENNAMCIHVVEFRLAQERYAVEQCHVQEVCPFDGFTPLPCVPRHILGIIDLRGQILPVLDLKKFFDLPETGIADLHMVLILRCQEVEIGLLADVVTGVRSLPVESLQSSLPTLTGIRAQYLKGIGPEQIVVLDACKILGDPQLIVNEQVVV